VEFLKDVRGTPLLQPILHQIPDICYMEICSQIDYIKKIESWLQKKIQDK